MMRRPRVFVGRAGVAVAGLLGAALMCCCCGAGSSATDVTAPAAVPTLGPNLLANGSFSLPAKDNGVYDPPAGGSIPGWAVGGPVEDWSTKAYGWQAPPNAGQALLLWYAATGGSVTQTIKTTPGWTYLVQWYESGYPNGYEPGIKVTRVLWDNALVAAVPFNSTGVTSADMHWTLRQEVVTATSTSSTLEFACLTGGFGPIVAGVSLAGDAKLFLPATATLTPTGKLVAVVRNATGSPLDDSSLSVKLSGSYKTVSYAPASKQLLASGQVASGQAVLQLKLPTSLKGQTIDAYATLQGPGYIPVTTKVAITVT